jgi:DUF971 family protein
MTQTYNRTPKNLQVVNGELAIKWDDESESFFTMERLRKACPCATCGSENVWERALDTETELSEKAKTLQQLDRIGGYAVQPRWVDGHATGIYSWEFLQKLDELLKKNGL